jgi:uncharacterized protein (TIGR02246 family)
MYVAAAPLTHKGEYMGAVSTRAHKANTKKNKLLIKKPLKDSEQIRRLLERYVAACRKGDVKKVLSFYDKDLVVYDMPPPLKYTSKEDFKKSWEKWFSSVFDFPVQYDVIEMSVYTSKDIAFAYGIIYMCGIFKEDKQRVESTIRHTTCLRKKNNKWRIIHDHYSVPIGEDGKALMSLGLPGGVMH